MPGAFTPTCAQKTSAWLYFQADAIFLKVRWCYIMSGGEWSVCGDEALGWSGGEQTAKSWWSWWEWWLGSGFGLDAGWQWQGLVNGRSVLWWWSIMVRWVNFGSSPQLVRLNFRRGCVFGAVFKRTLYNKTSRCVWSLTMPMACI